MKHSLRKIVKTVMPEYVVALVRDFRVFVKQVRQRHAEQSRDRLSLLRVKKMLAQREEVYLEIGAGERSGCGGWITMDLSDESDVPWDLTAGVPFPDSSVSGIYASHLLEHFDYEAIVSLLQECRRVLRPGGSVSVSVPDASLYISAYCNSSDLDRNRFFRCESACRLDTAIDKVNYIAYMGGVHRHMFDADGLLSVLTRAGFDDVQSREFDARLDPAERDPISVYAIAWKLA